MRPIRSILLILLLWFPIAAASAKENKDLLKANYYYAHYAYHDAIPYFEKIADSINTWKVYEQLANCYSITGELEKATTTYAKAVNLADCDSVVMLHYAQLLMQLTQYSEAERWLTTYHASHSADRRVANLIAGCRRAQMPAEHAMPEGFVQQMPFNTDGSDFAPTMWKGKLVFASDTAIDTRKKTDRWTGRSYYNIYSIVCDEGGHCNGAMSRVANAREVNIKYHNGPCTFSSDGSTMYYTRSRYNDGFFSKKAVTNEDSMILLEIMIATDLDTVNHRFKTVEPFLHNSKQYAVAHPAVSPDGKLIAFSSNMPGGSGMSDIYWCRKTDNGWGAPQSAGLAINTEGDEVFPYWADDTTLFFSSDGHEGMGGLDIYKSYFSDLTGMFSVPENAGALINSSYDDISLAMHTDGGSTYFSSNRPAQRGGDNIWFCKKERIFLQLTVLDSVSGQPIRNAHVALASLEKHIDAATDDGGKYFTRLYPEAQYVIEASIDGYVSRAAPLNATSAKDIDTLYKTIRLPKFNMPHDTAKAIVPRLVMKNRNIMDTPGVQQFTLNEIYEIGHFYYDFNKYNLKDIHKKFLDTLLIQLTRHPTMRIELRAHTDCRGSDASNLILSNNRALSVVNYLVEHGIPRARLEYRGLGSTMPFIKCPDCNSCTEEQHYQNRILEFKVLQL